jgi:hypothetical protein
VPGWYELSTSGRKIREGIAGWRLVPEELTERFHSSLGSDHSRVKAVLELAHLKS